MKRPWCFLAFIPSLIACGPREHTYRTVQEARGAHVFERHLPDVLPASSANILVIHKLGSAGDSGAFCFDSRERPTFFAKLSDSIDTRVWGNDFAKTIPSLNVVGVRPLAYDSARGHWVFFCTDGIGCTTCTWMKR